MNIQSLRWLRASAACVAVTCAALFSQVAAAELKIIVPQQKQTGNSSTSSSCNRTATEISKISEQEWAELSPDCRRNLINTQLNSAQNRVHQLKQARLSRHREMLADSNLGSSNAERARKTADIEGFITDNQSLSAQQLADTMVENNWIPAEIEHGMELRNLDTQLYLAEKAVTEAQAALSLQLGKTAQKADTHLETYQKAYTDFQAGLVRDVGAREAARIETLGKQLATWMLEFESANGSVPGEQNLSTKIHNLGVSDAELRRVVTARDGTKFTWGSALLESTKLQTEIQAGNDLKTATEALKKSPLAAPSSNRGAATDTSLFGIEIGAPVTFPTCSRSTPASETCIRASDNPSRAGLVFAPGTLPTEIDPDAVSTTSPPNSPNPISLSIINGRVEGIHFGLNRKSKVAAMQAISRYFGQPTEYPPGERAPQRVYIWQRGDVTAGVICNNLHDIREVCKADVATQKLISRQQ